MMVLRGSCMITGWSCRSGGRASTRRRTGSKFTGTLLASTEFPVGDAGANPQRIAPFSRKTWLQGVRDDIRKRSPLYAQDWFDGLRNPAKSAGACLFLYFAVLAPAVAFGGVMQTATCGALGPRDVLLSCGLSGMAYAYCAASFFLDCSTMASRETQRGAAAMAYEVDDYARQDESRRDGACREWLDRHGDKTRERDTHKDTQKTHRCLAGQPMTFVAPTGLTLSFIGALSAWTIKSGVPFLPMYAWCGCWTALYLAVLASFNA